MKKARHPLLVSPCHSVSRCANAEHSAPTRRTIFIYAVGICLSLVSQTICAPLCAQDGNVAAASAVERSTTSQSVKSELKVRNKYNQTYGENQSGFQIADIYRPDNSEQYPGILMIHGGGWIAGDKIMDAMHAKRIASRGYVVMAINYRLAPKYKFPAQIDDCFLAFDWLISHADELGVDRDRLGAWGYSAGGHLASLMATQPRDGVPRLGACVAGGSPCDLRILGIDDRIMAKLLGGTKKETPQIYDEASPAFHVSSDDPPMFLFHGTSDRLVRLAMSDHMDRLLTSAGVVHRYLVVEKKSHLTTFADMDALEQSIDFLDEHLKKPTEELGGN